MAQNDGHSASPSHRLPGDSERKRHHKDAIYRLFACKCCINFALVRRHKPVYCVFRVQDNILLDELSPGLNRVVIF